MLDRVYLPAATTPLIFDQVDGVRVGAEELREQIDVELTLLKQRMREYYLETLSILDTYEASYTLDVAGFRNSSIKFGKPATSRVSKVSSTAWTYRTTVRRSCFLPGRRFVTTRRRRVRSSHP